MSETYYFQDIIGDILDENSKSIPCRGCQGTGKHTSQDSLEHQVPVALLRAFGARSSSRASGEDCEYCDGTGQETNLRFRADAIAKSLKMPEYLTFSPDEEIAA